MSILWNPEILSKELIKGCLKSEDTILETQKFPEASKHSLSCSISTLETAVTSASN